MSKYIASFHDDGIELKIYLNEELHRLRSILDSSLQEGVINKNQILRENATRVIGVIDGYRKVEIDDKMIQQILKIQGLVEELAD